MFGTSYTVMQRIVGNVNALKEIGLWLVSFSSGKQGGQRGQWPGGDARSGPFLGSGLTRS